MMGLAGRIVVVLPTYNRALTLRRALDSLLAQTDADWVAYVLDDGSTDPTAAVLAEYGDPRIRYRRYPENRGGVAMNEIGMALACDEGVIWTRLGSDDWFGPDKLALDRLALAAHGACYGPYQHRAIWRGPWTGSAEWTDELNIPQDARAALLRGEFAVSWANVAMRTEVLRAVRAHYGCFVDPRLRNMEDYLFNTRAARFTEFAWRARSDRGGHALVGATAPAHVPWPYRPDAAYTIATESASYGVALAAWRTHDAQMTDRCRGEDAARGIEVRDLPRPTPSIVAL